MKTVKVLCNSLLFIMVITVVNEPSIQGHDLLNGRIDYRVSQQRMGYIP